MKCYKCNATLSEHDFCNKCGTDVRIYKKIIRSSEACYNMGLERAKNRDLTGAAELLRRSVKYNKNNINARNLLGLVYFEMGEVVAALSEWVISLNLQPDKNLADVYLEKVHRDSGRLDVINQTIKKYNQTLKYAQQDSEDLALIQMKKVLSLYPNLIKGHQLLALLYMKMGDYERALRPIKKALSIDRNNPLSLQYYEEIKNVLEASGKSVSSQKVGKNRHIPDNGKLAYVNVPESGEERTHGEDYILSQTKYKESSGNGGFAVLNIIIGIAIGLALAWFLILPSKIEQKEKENQAKLSEQNTLLDSRAATIANLQASIDELEDERDRLKASLDAVEEENTITSLYDMLLEGIELYMSGKYLAAYEQLNLIDITAITDENFLAVYELITAANNLQMAVIYYEEGYEYFDDKEFEEAAVWLQMSYDLNPEPMDTIYYLGRAYDRMNAGDETEAKAALYYNMVIERFPDTTTAKYAKTYMNDNK